MRLRFAAIMLILFLAAGNSESYEIGGKWNIGGTGFVEKSFVRVSLKITGNAYLYVNQLSDLSINRILSSDAETMIDRLNFIDYDLSCVTSYDFYLRIDAFNNTGLNVKIREENFKQNVNIPIVLPENEPTVQNPYELPAVTVNGLTYQASITSANSGIVKITGFVDTDFAGSIELNSDCVFWRDGTQKPSSSGNSSSGCNSGLLMSPYAIVMLMLFLGVNVIVRN